MRKPHAALVLAALLASISPALAAGGKAADGKAAAAGGGRGIELSALVLPVSHENRLVRYLFVSVRIDARDGKDLWELRNRSHFLRDAVLRAAHRTPLASDANGQVSREVVAAMVLAAAQAHDASADFMSAEIISLDPGADF